MFKRRTEMKPWYKVGVVACPKCASPIRIKKLALLAELADEFSAQCENCGNRGTFSKNGMKVESLPEERKKAHE